MRDWFQLSQIGMHFIDILRSSLWLVLLSVIHGRAASPMSPALCRMWDRTVHSTVRRGAATRNRLVVSYFDHRWISLSHLKRNKKVKILCFQLLQCDYLMVSFLLCHSKLNIGGMSSCDLGNSCWHFTDQTSIWEHNQQIHWKWK